LNKSFILILFFILTISLYAFNNEETAATIDTDPDIGKDIYFSQGCAACHKINGIGGNYGPDLTNINEKPYSTIKESILEPKKSIVKGYKNVMPSYKDTLGEADIANIIRFFKEIKEK